MTKGEPIQDIDNYVRVRELEVALARALRVIYKLQAEMRGVAEQAAPPSVLWQDFRYYADWAKGHHEAISNILGDPSIK